MNRRILQTLIAKDLRLYFRNRFFAFITIAGVILFTVVYFVLPSTVDESLTLGIYAPSIPDAFLEFLSSNDITLQAFDSDEALQQAVIDYQYPAGVSLEDNAISGILFGQATTVTVYFASDAPQEIIDAMRTVLRLALNELSYNLSGDPLALEFNEQIIGPDMTGAQLALRDRLLPLLAVTLLVMETMGLGGLISDEIEHGTLRALLVTPTTVSGFFTSKAVFGIALAFIQAALVMGITGGLHNEPLLILLTLLIGGLVVTGIAFLIGSVARGMMGVMAWGMLAIILMIIPAYGVVFPGTVSTWVTIIPSYYLFDTIHQVSNLGATWGAVSNNLVLLSVMGVALMGAGIFVLERKLR